MQAQHFKLYIIGNSLVGQWLGLYTFTAEGPGSIPGQGLRSRNLQTAWRGQNNNNNNKLYIILANNKPNTVLNVLQILAYPHSLLFPI